MPNSPTLIRLAFATLVFAVSQGAAARTFCCTDSGGRMICDDGVPRACNGRAYRELNERGMTIREYEAPLTPEQQAKRDAELAKKKEEDMRKAEEDRKDRTLLGTYASARDIDIARDRILADLDKTLKQAEQKLQEAEKRKAQLNNEAEFYQKHTIPGTLKGQLRDNEEDLKAQKKNVDNRLQDIEAARARFEADKKRYLSLTGGDKTATTQSR